jgi:hypothetical protein
MTVDAKTRAARQARYDRRRAMAEKVVPPGPYCYDATHPCPYWKRRTDKPDQLFGFCRLLKVGDATQGRLRNGVPRATMLLFDMVKECGVNLDEANDLSGQSEDHQGPF